MRLPVFVLFALVAPAWAGPPQAPKPPQAPPLAPAAPCPCGADCGCEPGTCPGRCPATAVAADPRKASVRVNRGNHSGTGTCIACEAGKSLVVSCNHIFADQPGPGAPFPRAPYPLPATVNVDPGQDAYGHLTCSRTLHGTAVDGDAAADLVLIVVDGEIPACALAGATATPGETVWHVGLGSGGGRGTVLPGRSAGGPSSEFTSSCPSVSGDSGAGVLNAANELVAVNCGRQGMGTADPERGTPVEHVHALAGRLGKTLFPRLTAAAAKRHTAKVATYAECQAKVKAGGRMTLYLGVPVPAGAKNVAHASPTDCPGLEAFAPGVYACFKGDDGLPKMQRVDAPKEAQPPCPGGRCPAGGCPGGVCFPQDNVFGGCPGGRCR